MLIFPLLHVLLQLLVILGYDIWSLDMQVCMPLKNYLELVIGLPKLKFEKDDGCDACQLSKQTRSSFNGKDILSTYKPLQLLQMDLFD